MSSLAARLEGLGLLHGRGLLSAQEFSRAKARVIAEHRKEAEPAPQGEQPVASSVPPAGPPPAQTLNPVVPGVGLALGAAAASGGLMG